MIILLYFCTRVNYVNVQNAQKMLQICLEKENDYRCYWIDKVILHYELCEKSLDTGHIHKRTCKTI